MTNVSIIWDEEDDPDGNYWHIVVEGHGITQEEVDEVLQDNNADDVRSRSSDRPITFGWTYLGRYIAVVWELACDDPRMIYPVTAYPVDVPADE